MRLYSKGMITRTIAVGLMALMACVNPLQTMAPRGGMDATVAKAAEKDAPYVGEVRLAVDEKAETAKQILADSGYEVIDQDLNEEAGSWWHKLGDQAVYMGIKRTADENKAIRDMKTMNMNGKYSYTDLKRAIEQNYSKAERLYNSLKTAVDEYRDNYNKKDYLAVKTHDILNYITEDDSGKKIGDLFLENLSKDTLLKMFTEGNQYLVSTLTRILIMTSEQKTKTGDIWTERMSAVSSYNDIIKDYAKKRYGKTTVLGEEKENIKNYIRSDLDGIASEILDRWDEIRGIFLSEKDMEERLKEASEDGIEDEEITELGEDIQNLSVVEYTKCVKYGKKSLYDFFRLSKDVFIKDITKLYPFVYALSEAQKELIPYMDYALLFQTALTRMGLRDHKKNVETRIDAVLKDVLKQASEVSLYEGVDRAMYGEHAAATSRAIQNREGGGVVGDLKKSQSQMMACGIVAGLAAVAGLIGVGVCAYYAVTEMNVFGGYLINIMDLAEFFEKLERWHPVPYYVAIYGLGCAVILAGVFTYLWIKNKKATHNLIQLSIPEVMVDFETENDAGKNVTYHVVKWNRDRKDNGDRADRGDLNGDAARQWLALYTTTDKTMGEPILADSIVAKTGENGGKQIPGNDYRPLTMFGSESIQNLVDETYSFEDDVDGIWMWYLKEGKKTDLIDDTEDGEPEEAGDAASGSSADTTGSNISGGSMALIGTGCAVGGFFLGLLCMYFFRRKKQIVK